MTKTFGQKLKQFLKQGQKIPHHCLMCGWLRPNQPGGNRYCKYPGKIKSQGGICLCWAKEPDPNKRVFSLIDLQEPMRTTHA